MIYESKYNIDDIVWHHERTYIKSNCECCKKAIKRYGTFVPTKATISAITFCYDGGIQYNFDDNYSAWEDNICNTEEDCQKKCNEFNKNDGYIGKIVDEEDEWEE